MYLKFFMQDFKHFFIEVNGVELHYVKAGNGKKLVILLHGWPEFWYSWHHQIEALSHQFTVVAVDMRGFNDSEKPHGIENYQAHIVTKDIAELIVKLGFKKAHIVGHDWGGAIAYGFAMNHRDLLDQLVILNCPHPTIFMKFLKKEPQQILKSWYMFLLQLPFLPEFVLKRSLAYFFRQFIRGWCYNKQAFSDEELQLYVNAYLKPGALTATINYYRAMMQLTIRKPNGIPRGKIANQTLIIWAENDKALSKEMTFGMEPYFDAPFEIKYISNCSHWVQNDAPDKVTEFLLSFLK